MGSVILSLFIMNFILISQMNGKLGYGNENDIVQEGDL
ncbi:Uncharacterised protein [Mycobacteroides abscessus subsp. abscessus]|nr:Uncharacterised protein [Mycobacteroides abscessus subsp. abscessus]